MEGECCNIHTHSRKVYTGTLLFKNQSVHANSESRIAVRTLASTFIRLDEEVYHRDDTKELGISNGDMISFNLLGFNSQQLAA